ncbi:hypothetical protein [Vitiosangium sp. GDMCC 1.1324]|uniref:hypothetical protein n=1 Tax=Vitiosangium sp. (strain GDMCC 1.1324) TaxID=2138576 RepID=UPI000D35DF55|nr:hypothetical protein [Vitiosangium sp. GDMCC 1.1324]PTL75405.1 hypothetical protein DAT35_54805 [Vitiosangium sp. GDMCC 1.1324]
MGGSEVAGIALSVVKELKDASTVNTFLVVASYLTGLKVLLLTWGAILKVILRTWERKLLSPEPMLRTRSMLQ